MERPDQLDAPWVRTLIKYGPRAQVTAFRLTNGRVGSRWRLFAGFRNPVPTLLLDHVGRSSGRTYTTPLLYLEDGRDLVVAASQGGLPDHPQWYANLRSTPETTVHVRGRGRLPVRARRADEAERAGLWPRLVRLYPGFADYQRWTEREIPVVVLEPR